MELIISCKEEEEHAESLIMNPCESFRDKGRHLLMDMAHTDDEWRALTFRFIFLEFSDLRKGVVDRFLHSAPPPVLREFVEEMVSKCKFCLRDISSREELYKNTKYMHWILNCLSVLGDKEMLESETAFLRSRFGHRLPTPIKKRLDELSVPS